MTMLRVTINHMEVLVDTSTLKTLKDAAAALDKTIMTLYRWQKEERLFWVVIGGKKFIPQSEIDRILAADTPLTQAMNKGEV